MELDVNSLGQQITQWNRAYWRLEIIEVYRLVQGDADLTEIWRRFEKDSRLASIKWTVSLMILGQRLSKDWEAAISDLERESEFDSVSCPMCGATINADANACAFCGEAVNGC